VCAGDSTTQGVASANWVGLLQDQLGSRGFQFVRAAWGGYLSHSLLLRIDSVIACQPDAVVVMIGTNDVMATTSDAWRESYSRQSLPEVPTLETYRTWLDEIVRRLLAETSARVALLEVPPIGEDLGSAFNERVASFNQVVREVAEKHGVEVLPLNARLAELIEESSTAPPYDGGMKEIKSALLQRLLLRRRWDTIAARAGRVVLTDNIHLTDRAGREAAALVRVFVEDLAVERRTP
jgi:lysophospholipase L1-like esterase